jgi:hypothetical protein
VLEVLGVELARRGGDPPHLIEKLDGWLAEKEITIVNVASNNNNCLFECTLRGLEDVGIPRAVRLQYGPHMESHISDSQYGEMLRKVATNGIWSISCTNDGYFRECLRQVLHEHVCALFKLDENANELTCLEAWTNHISKEQGATYMMLMLDCIGVDIHAVKGTMWYGRRHVHMAGA